MQTKLQQGYGSISAYIAINKTEKLSKHWHNGNHNNIPLS